MIDGAIEKVAEEVESAADEARPWVVRWARFGFIAKGVVYLLLGLLSFRAALGFGDPEVDRKDILINLLAQPFGNLILIVIAAGLLGYALWSLVQTFLDPEHKGEGLRGLVRRGAYLAAGLGYGALALSAVQIGLRLHWGGGEEMTPEDWTALVLQQPAGRWLIGIAGLLVIGFGIGKFSRAFKSDLTEELWLGSPNTNGKNWINWVGRVGLIAKGVLYGLMGFLLIRAAWQYDPEEAAGLGEALFTLAVQPFGAWRLGLVAIGLAAYGVYYLVQARYRPFTV